MRFTTTFTGLWNMSFNSGLELYIEAGNERGKFISLSNRQIRVGRLEPRRHRNGWVMIDDPTLSAHHASLIWDTARKSFHLVHESSTNPTLVNGKTIRSQLLQVNDQIRMGNVVMRVLAQTTPSHWVRPTLYSRFFGRPDPYQVCLFYQNLGVMLQSGIPMTRALETLSAQVSDPILAVLVREVATDIPKGNSLSGALRGQGAYFPMLDVNVVKAGETTGRLGELLRRLAETREYQLTLKRKIQSSLTYPLFVLVIGLGLLLVIARQAFAAMTPMLAGSGRELPLITRCLLRINEAAENPLLVVGVGALAVALVLALMQGFQRPAARDWLDEVTGRLPLIGPLRRNLGASRLCSSLALMYRAGIPMSTALRESAATCGQIDVRRVAEQAVERLEAGETLVGALAHDGVLPHAVLSMVDVGLESGTLDKALDHVARWLKEEVERVVEQMVVLLEPVTVIILGVFVGFIVLAVFVPLYQIAISL